MSPIRKCRGFGSAVDAIIQKASEQPRLCKRHGEETGEEYTEVEETPDDCSACRRIFEKKHDDQSFEKEHVPGSKAFQKEAAPTGGLFNKKPGGLFNRQPQQVPAPAAPQTGGLFNKKPGGLFNKQPQQTLAPAIPAVQQTPAPAAPQAGGLFNKKPGGLFNRQPQQTPAPAAQVVQQAPAQQAPAQAAPAQQAPAQAAPAQQAPAQQAPAQAAPQGSAAPAELPEWKRKAYDVVKKFMAPNDVLKTLSRSTDDKMSSTTARTIAELCDAQTGEKEISEITQLLNGLGIVKDNKLRIGAGYDVWGRWDTDAAMDPKAKSPVSQLYVSKIHRNSWSSKEIGEIMRPYFEVTDRHLLPRK